jgi:hypothetical protein
MLVLHCSYLPGGMRALHDGSAGFLEHGLHGTGYTTVRCHTAVDAFTTEKQKQQVEATGDSRTCRLFVRVTDLWPDNSGIALEEVADRQASIDAEKAENTALTSNKHVRASKLLLCCNGHSLFAF